MANRQLPWALFGKSGCAGLAWLLGVKASAWLPAPGPTQAQVARRFLLEVVQGRYPLAYRRLAPEVRATLRLPAFAAAAQPLWQAGQQRGPEVELYKLGARLSGSHGQWFYSFSFARDSLHRPPPVLLEVTFRDTATRQVLGFSLRQLPRARPPGSARQ